MSMNEPANKNREQSGDWEPVKTTIVSRQCTSVHQNLQQSGDRSKQHLKPRQQLKFKTGSSKIADTNQGGAGLSKACGSKQIAT